MVLSDEFSADVGENEDLEGALIVSEGVVECQGDVLGFLCLGYNCGSEGEFGCRPNWRMFLGFNEYGRDQSVAQEGSQTG